MDLRIVLQYSLERKLNITIIASQTFGNLENNANNAWLPTTKLCQRFNFVSLTGRLNPFATSLSESRLQNSGFNSSHWHAPQIRSALNETNLLTRIGIFHKYETERLWLGVNLCTHSCIGISLPKTSLCQAMILLILSWTFVLLQYQWYHPLAAFGVAPWSITITDTNW